MTMPAFRQWVDRARAEHVGSVLHNRHIALTGRGRNRAGACPNCGGTDRFGVDLDKQLFNCRQCGGRGHGAISLVMFLDHVNFLQACETIVGEPPPAKEPPAPRKSKAERGKVVAIYDYTDELEHVGYQVLRYEPKGFSQRRPDPDHDGEWIDNLDGVRLVPFRLPALIEAVASGQTVHIVEGEKDAINGVDRLGIVTTTTAMGLAGKGHWERGDYDEFFAGAHVVLIPDQDKDRSKGQRLAQIIGKRLKPIAASVSVLTLPMKDLSDWIEAGGTREAFDTMPLDELIETNGHDHNDEVVPDVAQLWQPPGDMPAQPVELPATWPFPIKGEDIPRRPWIVPGFLLRNNVTVLVAPPGSGKSLFTLQQALMCSTGMAWGGWQPCRPVKALIINAEDDGDELRRRLYAAAKVMNIDPETVKDRVAFVDNPQDIVIAKSNSNKTVLRTPIIEAIVKLVLAHQFDVVIVDPLAETFAGDENSNSELKWCAVLWREVARRTNAAVLLVHHTRKYANDSAGDMDAARGGGALVGVARVVSTLFNMSAKEAEIFKIDAERRAEYLRYDDAKANLSLVTFAAKWFFKRTYTLPNASQDEPADNVGVLEPWTPPGPFAGLTDEIANDILDAINFGMTDENGQATGDRYSKTRRGGNKRWAGAMIVDRLDCDEDEAQELIDLWIKNGVITETESVTSTSKGKPRKGLIVNAAARPGTTTDERAL